MSFRVDNYIITSPIIDILYKLKSSLVNGKLARIEQKGNWIKVTCPEHNDGLEKNPSCGIYIGEEEEIYYHCFTCNANGDFISFISKCFDCSYGEAKNWLIYNFGQKSSEQEITLDPIVLPSKNNIDYLDENILSDFQSWHPYMDKRHLGANVCKEFKVKYDPKTECLVFPVYDNKGKLYMLTRRSVNNKTFIIDHDKEKVVYLLYYIKQHNIKEITIVESQINALTCWSWGIPSVATFGCNITTKQIDEINKSGVNHIYMCYDGDEAGIKGTKKFIEHINKDILIDVIIMQKGKDVNDLTEEEFNCLPIMSSDEWLQKYNKNIK